MIGDNYKAAAEVAQTRRSAVSCCVGFFCLFLSLIFLYAPWRRHQREQLRARDLPITIKNAQPIIAAITQYKKEKGKFPKTLEELIPKYLERIPDAGPVAEKGWLYRSIESKDSSTILNKTAGDWALYVWVRDEYSPNIWGFGDVFVYHPSGKYPEYGYGGGLVPFQNWGYYIE